MKRKVKRVKKIYKQLIIEREIQNVNYFFAQSFSFTVHGHAQAFFAHSPDKNSHGNN